MPLSTAPTDEIATCGVPAQSGRPCAWRRPCGVHTEAWLQKRELAAMGIEDRASKASCRPACGWPGRGGEPCTEPAPCGWHAAAREKQRREQERATREEEYKAAPKCGKPTRGGQPCQQTLPCRFHSEIIGMKRCASTLDTDPFERCRRQCPTGTLFCEQHEAFPDLGRRAAIYADACKRRGEPVDMAGFMRFYPDATDRPDIFMLQMFCAKQRAKMAGEEASPQGAVQAAAAD